MEPKYLFLGALALAIVGGTTVGATMNTEPLQKVGDPLGSIPQHEFALRDTAAYARMQAPKDQYAIETTEGRYEVAELSARGLYRNRPYGPRYYAQAVEDRHDAAFDAQLASAEWKPDVNFADAEIERARLAARAEAAAQAVREAAAMPATVAATAPATPAVQPSEGQPRTIDVTAELALRD